MIATVPALANPNRASTPFSASGIGTIKLGGVIGLTIFNRLGLTGRLFFRKNFERITITLAVFAIKIDAAFVFHDPLTWRAG